MSATEDWPVYFSGENDEIMPWLRSHGIERIRVEYSDFGGVARGKAVTLKQFPHAISHGVGFCASVFAFDMPANVVPGTDYAEARGFGDFIVMPDLTSLRLLRHESGTAQVMGTLVWPDGSKVESCPRNILNCVVERASKLGFKAFAAPEFEFYLLDVIR